MHRALFTLLLAAGLALPSASTLAQDCAGPGDLDGDGLVNLADHALLYGCLAGPEVSPPPPGCSQKTFDRCDRDGDNDVDLTDHLAFASAFAATYFPYGPHRPDREAEMLAMEVADTLRARDVEYDRVLRDLALIRTAYPALVSVIDDEDYVPDQLLIGVESGQPLDDYYALNNFYLVEDEEVHSFYRLLTFCDNLNAPLLAGEYANLPSVAWADPNWFIGIDDYITIPSFGDTYRYEIDDGFHDCFDGCDCHRVWTIDVDSAGNVTLVDYIEFGQSWCVF